MQAQVKLAFPVHAVHRTDRWSAPITRFVHLGGVIDWGNAAYGDWLYDAAWLLYWWPRYPAWQRIDIRAELDQHWKAGRGPPADLESRLRCYQLHIGLDAMTYNAFTGRFDELARNAEQTMTLI